jgi:hypothetical protein
MIQHIWNLPLHACAGVWHAISHVLHMNCLRVFSAPSRTVVTAYAFIVIVFSNTYLANLAAFLTVDRLNNHINSFHDLWSKAVGTYPVYIDLLDVKYKLNPVSIPAVGNGVSPPFAIVPCHLRGCVHIGSRKHLRFLESEVCGRWGHCRECAHRHITKTIFLLHLVALRWLLHMLSQQLCSHEAIVVVFSP